MKLTTRILILIGICIILTMSVFSVYIVKSVRKSLLISAYNEAENINNIAYTSIVSIMNMRHADYDVIHNYIKNLNNMENEVLQLKIIHNPKISTTKIASDRAINSESDLIEFPSDDIERRALSGEAIRREILFNKNDTELRAVQNITPINADRNCISCHRVEENTTLAALLTVVSLETTFKTMQNRTKVLISILLMGSLLTMTLLYFALRKTVIKPILQISSTTQMIANEGDLSKKVEIDSDGEIGDLAKSINNMTQDLQKTTVSRDYVDLILESMADSLIVVDLNGTIQTINKETMQLLGYKEKELIGKSINSIIEDGESFKKQHIDDLIKTGSFKRIEKVYIAKDGGRIDISLSCANMCARSGLVEGIVCVGKDISESKKMQEEIRKQSEFSQMVIESLPFPFYVINVDDYSIEMANSATYQGTIPTNMTCHVLTHHSPKPCGEGGCACPLDQVKLNKKPVKVEHIHYDKNGTEKNTEVYGFPIFDDSGNVIQMIEVCLDITDRKKALKELEIALEKAEQSDKLKSLFLANMSHEIRTPLNAILGFTDLVEQSVKHLVGPEEMNFFDTIRTSGERLMRTIHEVLDISQIEAGVLELSLINLDLVEIVDKVVAEFKNPAENKELNLTFNSTVPTGIIKADKYCIVQALTNILDNAVKYTEKGKITVSLKAADSQLTLEVKDTGIGISAAYLEHIFEVFSQESMGYTKKFQGVGLGLALTKRYLDLCDVTIDLKSKKGVGSTFTLTFRQIAEALSV